MTNTEVNTADSEGEGNKRHLFLFLAAIGAQIMLTVAFFIFPDTLIQWVLIAGAVIILAVVAVTSEKQADQ